MGADILDSLDCPTRAVCSKSTVCDSIIKELYSELFPLENTEVQVDCSRQEEIIKSAASHCHRESYHLP
ncbi:hypothetical protein SNE40_022729 [Patella caerulea]|uniref:Uncharacterized protein n=1 Tax=Patella caerulea TaxID=87958 RepID=A0AAN8IZV4_PATCE